MSTTFVCSCMRVEEARTQSANAKYFLTYRFAATPARTIQTHFYCATKFPCHKFCGGFPRCFYSILVFANENNSRSASRANSEIADVMYVDSMTSSGFGGYPDKWILIKPNGL